MEKIVKQIKGRVIDFKIILNNELEYVIIVKVFGIQVIELNLHDVFETIREKRSLK